MTGNLITKIGTGIRTFGAKTWFRIRKISPELCLIGGAGLVVTGTVFAVRAGIKTKEILDDANDKIDSIKADAEDSIISEEDANCQIRDVKRQATFAIARYGAPAVGATISGVTLMCVAKQIVSKRYGLLLGAYNALEASYREYQNQMKPYEQQMLNDTRRQLVANAQAANNGEVLSQEQINEINRQVAASVPFGNPYRFVFSAETSTEWHPHGPSNISTIQATEDWATTMLRLRGHLFVNDVLDHLGMDKVPWGQFVGWLRGANNADENVELFGRDYLEALEMDDDACKLAILMDFNCDGLIWDKI